MLGWRDFAATALVTAAAVVFGSFIGAIGWSAFADPRLATLALGFVGLAACIAGSVEVTSLRGRYLGFMSMLGGTGGAIFVGGLLFGWSLAPGLLMGDIALMWVLATTRHALPAPGTALHT